MGNVTIHSLLVDRAELVTAAQTTGGVRLVAEYKFKLLAQAGQVRTRDTPSGVETLSAGCGRKTSIAAETGPVLHPLTAATS